MKTSWLRPTSVFTVASAFTMASCTRTEMSGPLMTAPSALVRWDLDRLCILCLKSTRTHVWGDALYSLTCLYMHANTQWYAKSTHTEAHTLATTRLIWSVISNVKAWQKASSSYSCNERSVVRSSTQVWPRGTWPDFNWCIGHNYEEDHGSDKWKEWDGVRCKILCREDPCISQRGLISWFLLLLRKQ